MMIRWFGDEVYFQRQRKTKKTSLSLDNNGSLWTKIIVVLHHHFFKFFFQIHLLFVVSGLACSSVHCLKLVFVSLELFF